MSDGDKYFKVDCDKCGQSVEVPNELYDASVTCPTCSNQFNARPKVLNELVVQSTWQPATPPPILHQSGQMDELFFDEGGIIVTKTRFVARSQTFAMSGITSVRGIETPPSRGGLVFLLIIGLLMIFASPFVGVPIIILAAVCLYFQKSTFSVSITTAGGEVAAYTSTSGPFIARVIDALTQAFIARG